MAQTREIPLIHIVPMKNKDIGPYPPMTVRLPSVLDFSVFFDLRLDFRTDHEPYWVSVDADIFWGNSSVIRKAS